jgi:2-dehydro-3-deoxygluconokinase
VILTRRESRSASHNAWSACLDDGEQFIESRRYEITHMVERVGGGDAFDAGLIYGMLKLPSLQAALEFASATAVLKHSIPGDFSRSTVEEVKRVVERGWIRESGSDKFGVRPLEIGDSERISFGIEWSEP